MKFLLVGINSKYIHSNPAIYSLRGCLGEDQDAVKVIEYTINQDIASIRSGIYKERPDAIGFSCYIWNIRYVLELAEDLSRLISGIPIWFGGPEVSYRAESLLEQYDWLSGVMCGEGEASFAALVRRMKESNFSPEGISGLVYRGVDGKIYDTRPVMSSDFEHLPFLYSDENLPENRIIYYETSRGCPYRCSYCLSSVDKKIRLRGLELVFQELDFFLERKVPQVKMIDRTFNCVRSRAREIWKYIRDHDNGITNFHFEIGADLLEEEDFAILAGMRQGLVQFEIGVQTANPQTLKAIRRDASLDKICESVRRVRALNNIHQHLDLIAGLPFEDYESFGRSFDLIYELNPDQLQLGFLKVLSGTQMEREAEQYGMIYSSQPPYEVLATRWLSYDELCRLKQIEDAVETFYNSRQFEGTIHYLRQKVSRPFELFELLADWLVILCKDGGRPGRKRLYEEIAGCLRMAWPEECELWSQLLTMDYFARENSGARLSFSKISSSWKEMEKTFYIEEAVKRQYLSGYEAYDSRQLQHMTHIEVFDWNLPEYIQGGKLCSGKTVVLFDYRNRDFRSANAKMIIIQDV